MGVMFIKICGVRTPDVARAVADLGADAIGFVFAAGSVRQIAADAVRDLATPAHLERVGVFTDAPIDEIVHTVRAANLDTAQLHGPRHPGDIERLLDAGIRVIVARSVSELHELPDASAVRLLVDGDEPGSGTAYELAPSVLATLPPSWILAGGLTPANVTARVAALAPSGVDVSSGVESSRGVKSIALVEQFIERARAAG